MAPQPDTVVPSQVQKSSMQGGMAPQLPLAAAPQPGARSHVDPARSALARGRPRGRRGEGWRGSDFWEREKCEREVGDANRQVGDSNNEVGDPIEHVGEGLDGVGDAIVEAGDANCQVGDAIVEVGDAIG